MIIGARSQPRPTSVRQAPAPARRAAPPPRPAATQTFHDAGRSGNYGVPAANHYKAAPAYHQAVKQVFKAQPPVQKATIIRGLVHQKAYNTPEFRAVHDVFSKLPAAEQGMIASYSPRETSAFMTAGKFVPPPRESFNPIGGLGKLVTSGLGDIGKGIGLKLPGSGGIGDVRSLGGAISPQGILKGTNAAAKGFANTAAFISKKTQVAPGGPGNVETLGTGGPTLSKRVASDAVNFVAAPFTTGALVARDVAHPGKLVSDFNPLPLIEHPGQHPLLAVLAASGLGAAVERPAAAAARAAAPEGSTAADVLATNRQGVHLTGKLTHERPQFSPVPHLKQFQLLHDSRLYEKAPTGELVAKRRGTQERLLSKGIGQIVGQRERIRTMNRDIIHHQREGAIRPSAGKVVGHAAKTALTYNPDRAAVPGAGVLARIADLTIRRPETFSQDLAKHVGQVTANRANLLGDKAGLAAHDQYVKALQKEIDANRSPKDVKAAFAAAEKYRQQYQPAELEALRLGHFGADMTREGLLRRTLMHYATTHMGAKPEGELGLRAADGSPLSNEAILADIHKNTGGRLPAFTSDKVRFDREQAARSANYVSSDRMPLPETRANSLYAYTHGLTNPSHRALTEQHAFMQGIVDSHHSQAELADQLVNQLPGGGFGATRSEAERAMTTHGLKGFKPINLAQIHHPQDALDKAMQDAAPATMEEEAVRRSLDLQSATEGHGAGKWGLIDEHALRVLRQHQGQISPNVLLRSIRGLNNQFRTVALSTSAKHVPGVAQENLLRDIGYGVGLRSWVTGHRILGHAREINPELGREAKTRQTGGQVAGMTEAGKTYLVSDHWRGTSLHPFLKAMETTFRAPGPRQLRTAWRAWTTFAIKGVKKALEEQHQTAGLGKFALRQHGYAEAARTQGMVGLIHRAWSLQGKMLDDATRGLFDPAKARQARATINQIYGKWTDLSPQGQTGLMVSPFGLWWVNSAKFLARMPLDQPVKTGLLATATAQKEKQREQLGMNFLSPNQLPLYEMGGIPAGKNVIAQNYYSPFGVANDTIGTADSLVLPWAIPALEGGLGVNWLGHPLESPGNPRGSKHTSEAQKAQYIIDSWLASFVPLYTKAKQVAQGGSSAYDVTDKGVLPPLLRGESPPTKKPGKGAGTGLKKALQPYRSYKRAATSGSSSGSGSGGGWGPPASKSGGGWGPPASKKSSGDGWGS